MHLLGDVLDGWIDRGMLIVVFVHVRQLLVVIMSRIWACVEGECVERILLGLVTLQINGGLLGF